MIRIQIGAAERPLAEADAHWIEQQINGRRHDGLTVCVKVQIDDGDLHMHLSTPGCGTGGGGGRPPNRSEQAILELWSRHHLDQMGWSPGNVISFLKQLSSLI